MKEENKNGINNNLSKKETNSSDNKSQIKYKDYNLQIKAQKSSKIYNIIKVNKKRGRLNKKSKKKNIYAPHNKLTDDNILRKIKARFLRNLLNFLNFLYSEHIRIINSKLILPIDPSIARNIHGSDNSKWFDKKIKDVFSYKVSSIFKAHNPDENIIKIGQFYQKEKNNHIKLIKVLEMKIREIYDIYIKDEKVEGFEEFDNLDNDIKQLEKVMHKNNEDKVKIEEYLEKYGLFAKNLEKKFQNKQIRNHKK